MSYYKTSPESEFFSYVYLGFAVLISVPTLYLMSHSGVYISAAIYIAVLIGSWVLAAIIAYPITQWYFYWRKDKPKKLEIGKGDGEYHPLPVPMQCAYCGTSLQPSSKECPKCGRMNL